MLTKQMTFKVNDTTIKIKATQRLKCGNPCGFTVKVNDIKYFILELDINKAIDIVYVNWCCRTK